MKFKLTLSSDRLIFREIYIGDMPKSQLLKQLTEHKIGLNSLAVMLINHKRFTISPSKKKLRTVEIFVNDLGFPNGATITEICQKAHECMRFWHVSS